MYIAVLYCTEHKCTLLGWSGSLMLIVWAVVAMVIALSFNCNLRYKCMDVVYWTNNSQKYKANKLIGSILYIVSMQNSDV